LKAGRSGAGAMPESHSADSGRVTSMLTVKVLGEMPACAVEFSVALWAKSYCSRRLQGSGERIQEDFGLPNLVQFPITEALSLAGDGGKPLVVSDPAGAVGRAFSELGVAVVREVAKLRSLRRNSLRYDSSLSAFVAQLPSTASSAGGADSADPEAFLLHPAVVRRSDTSARSVNEWTGERILQDEDIAEDVKPQDVQPLGNYAVQITWEDGFNQVAPFELLRSLPRLSAEEAQRRAVESVPVPALE
jgi:hypothetical protein